MLHSCSLFLLCTTFSHKYNELFEVLDSNFLISINRFVNKCISYRWMFQHPLKSTSNKHSWTIFHTWLTNETCGLCGNKCKAHKTHFYYRLIQLYHEFNEFSLQFGKFIPHLTRTTTERNKHLVKLHITHKFRTQCALKTTRTSFVRWNTQAIYSLLRCWEKNRKYRIIS